MTIKTIEERVDDLGKTFDEMEPFINIGQAALEWYIETENYREKDAKLQKLVKIMETYVQSCKDGRGCDSDS